jgi:putative membrane protein
MKPLASDNGSALPALGAQGDNEAVDSAGVDGEQEPDYRMSLAAERTYLAYLRTGLALLAAGVAVVGALPNAGAEVLRRCVGLVLVVVGGTLLAVARPRWVAVDRAMRRGEPLPTSLVIRSLGLVLVVAAVAAGVVVLVL